MGGNEKHHGHICYSREIKAAKLAFVLICFGGGSQIRLKCFQKCSLKHIICIGTVEQLIANVAVNAFYDQQDFIAKMLDERNKKKGLEGGPSS